MATNQSPRSEQFQRLCEEVARRIIEGRQADDLLPGIKAEVMQVRTHVRQKSDLQKIVQDATRAGLMRRDARGRFIALDARVTRQIRRIQRKRQIERRPSPAQLRANQAAVFKQLQML